MCQPGMWGAPVCVMAKLKVDLWLLGGGGGGAPLPPDVAPKASEPYLTAAYLQR